MRTLVGAPPCVGVPARTARPGVPGRRRGQTLVEFALTFPVFILLFFSLVEGGRLMFTWVLLSEATRDGARTAVLPSTTSTTTITTKVNEFAKYAPGFSTSSVTVSRNGTEVSGSFTKSRGDTMKVQIVYTFAFLSGNTLPFVSREIITYMERRAEG